MCSPKKKSKLPPIDVISCAKLALRERIILSFVPESFLHEDQKKGLLDIVHRTCSHGESNSVILTGPRGAGKTVLMNAVLSELTGDFDIACDLIIVKLNGLLQTDDRIALTEIARQLDLDATVDQRQFVSFAETLQFMIDALKSGSQSSKAVVFVLENFDLFAQHRNQTLLYNLFDVTQSAQTPICVIGITCRLDVIELLEKRVKSRFSHRQIHLSTHRSFPDYVNMFVSFLSLPENFVDSKFATSWNNRVKKLSADSTVVSLLKTRYNLSTEGRELQRFVTYPICRISCDHPDLRVEDFVESARLLSVDCKTAMLRGLSVLELCLIVAMKHLTNIYEGEPFNFEMVYNEYRKFTKNKSTMQSFERPVVMKAFERLKSLEFVCPTDASNQKILSEYRLMTMLLHSGQVQEVLQKYPNCPTEVKHWACSSYAA